MLGDLRGLVVGRLDEAAGGAHGYVLSHLVVEPTARIALGRLVPLALARSRDKVVHLGCDRAAFEQLPRAEASRLVPGVERTFGIVGSLYSAIGMAANDIVPAGRVILHAGAPLEAAGPGASLLGVDIDRDDRDRVVGFVALSKRRWGRRRVSVVTLP